MDIPPTSSIGVVIATLGVRASLRETLLSLASQTLRPVEIIIVNQGEPNLVDSIILEFADLEISVIACYPGLSRARNLGIAALDPGCHYLVTLDDDVVLSPDAFSKFVEIFMDRPELVGAVSGCLRDAETDSTRVRFSASQKKLNRRTVWTNAMESTTMYARKSLNHVGGFDETLGLGSGSPWGSGEGTELLLRLLAAGYEIWFEPLVRMTELNVASDKAYAPHIRARNYARGTGRVYAIHSTALEKVSLLAKSVVRVLVSAPGSMRQRMAFAALCGRVEGLTGRVMRHG